MFSSFQIPNCCEQSSPFLVADVGNSSIHMRFCHRGKDSVFHSDWKTSFPLQPETPFHQWISGCLEQNASKRSSQSPICCVVSSVNQTGLDTLGELLNKWTTENNLQQIPLSVLGFSDLNMAIHVEEPEKTGIDRLVASFFVKEFYKSFYPDVEFPGAIVVDAGSAVTVDYLDPSMSFQGGMIFPGPGLASESLFSKTDALPKIEIPDDFHPENSGRPMLGKSTQQAIEAGLFFSQWQGISGAVRELQFEVARKERIHPLVFACGGGLAPFRSHLPEEWNFRQNFVLDGLVTWAISQQKTYQV